MDEAHDLGRGRCLDIHGYVNGFDLFIRQLALVSTACRERGLRPMIWSDMFFRLGNARHQDLGSEPLMGAGVRIRSRLWYDHVWSAQTNRACINACFRKGLKEIFFTIRGDEGAICHFDSVWTGLTESADLCFGIDDRSVTSQRYHALTGSDCELNRLPGLLHRENLSQTNTDMAVFWDDLLLGLGW